MKEVLVIVGSVLLALLIGIFLDRIISPWRSRRLVDKNLRRIREGTFKPPRFEATVMWDEDGVWVQKDETGNSICRLSWKDIARVVAFKKDSLSTDCICLFLSKSDDSGLEIHEEMNEWAKFIESLPKHLPDCKSVDAWLWNVMTPAFETSLTEIFSRAEGASRDGGTN